MGTKIHLGIIYFFLVLCATSAEETVYMVKKGDTIFSIAKTFEVTNDALMQHNKITDPQKLKIGQQLIIPSSISTSEQIHRVIKGETLYGIARYYDISLQLLLDANNLKNDYVLKINDSLHIPAKTTLTPASAVPRIGILQWPVNTKDVRYVTGKFSGVILSGEKRESVKSITSGTVVSAGPYHGFGKVVIVEVSGGYTYIYSGLDTISVKANDKVRSGTELGKLGTSEPQLLFLVYQNNSPVDPAQAPRT
jgi:murein DD-endopeptidase MepM/ murein hydrolase activator NlpD